MIYTIHTLASTWQYHQYNVYDDDIQNVREVKKKKKRSILLSDNIIKRIYISVNTSPNSRNSIEVQTLNSLKIKYTYVIRSKNR